MAAKKKTDPYVESAANQSILRFGGQESVLSQLLRDAEDRRDTALRQAKSGRQYTVGSVDQALPAVQQAYSGASAALPPAFAAAGGTEAQALTARMAESQAQATSQLQARRVSAIEGEGAARTQAARDYSSDRGKVLASALDLAQQKGAFTTETIKDMMGADAKSTQDAAELKARLDQDERNSVRSSGIDPDTGAPIPGGKLDPKAKNGGHGWASDTAQGDAADTVQNALKWARTLKGGGVSRADAAAALLTGADEQKADVIDPNTGKRAVWQKGEIDPSTGKSVDPQLVNTPKQRTIQTALPQIDSQLFLSAALDMAYDKHLSTRNQALLHARGIKLEPLGLVTAGEWKRRLRAALAPDGRPGNSPGIGNTGSRPT